MFQFNNPRVIGFIQSTDLSFSLALKSHGTDDRGVIGGWAGWEIAHPVFGRIEGAAGQQRHATLLIAHPVFGSQLRPWMINLQRDGNDVIMTQQVFYDIHKVSTMAG